MARSAFKATLGAATANNEYAAVAGSAADFSATVDASAVTAAIAVLVADAASPTQAHVTTLNGAYTTFIAAFNAQQAAVAGDVLISVDTTALNTSNKVMSAIRALLQALRNSGILTV